MPKKLRGAKQDSGRRDSSTKPHPPTETAPRERRRSARGFDKEQTKLLREALSPNYLLIRRIGGGAMGTVFLARDPALKRQVAVKVLSSDLAADRNARARFQREAQAVAAISHPNVVAVYNVGKLTDGTPYFVMQYVNGPSMARRLAAEGPLDPPEAMRIIGAVASGLAAAHRQGIIHRDIKPANVLFDEETGTPVVTDFGIAAIKPREDDEADLRLTETGATVGTPAYMSPEQLVGGVVTDRTDVYGLAVLGYELVSGEGPYEMSSNPEVLAARLRDPPRRLSELRPEVDPELETLLASCLAQQADSRPGAQEIARRLMPGAGVLLEWPPPGLEGIRGAGIKLGVAFCLSSLAFVIPLLLRLLEGALPRVVPSWLASLLAGGGAVGLAVSTIWLVRLAAHVARAGRHGFAWFTIAEVLTDHRADTGDLIAGSREYAGLSAAQRSSARLVRVAVGVALLVAGVSPPAALILALRLAAGGTVGPGLFTAVLLGPSALLLVLVGIARRFEHHSVRQARNMLAHRRALTETSAKLIAPWYESFEAVREGQWFGRGPSGLLLVAPVAAALVALALAVGGGLGAWIFAVEDAGDPIWRRAQPLILEARARAPWVELGRRYRVPPNRRLSEEESGRAVQTLYRVGRSDPPAPYERAPAATIADAWLLSAPDEPLDPSPSQWPALLFAMAAEELTAPQQAYLDSVAGHPGFAPLARAARAGSADVLAARYFVPFPEMVDPIVIRPPELDQLRDLAYAGTARAALQWWRGDAGAAEATLRQVISLGVVMADDSRFLNEAAVAAALIEVGLRSLEELYRVSNRVSAAWQLATDRDSLLGAWRVSSAAVVQASAGSRQLGADRFRALEAVVLDSTALPALRWELVRSLVVLAPCASVPDAMFGPRGDRRGLWPRLEASLVGRPSDKALFDHILADTVGASEQSDRSAGRQAVENAGRVVGRLLHNRRLGHCAELAAGAGNRR